MSTSAASISLLHNASNIYTNSSMDNVTNDLASYDGAKIAEDNIKTSLSSILPLALHNLSKGERSLLVSK